jgi:membrane associated rhomboid family serine protease
MPWLAAMQTLGIPCELRREPGGSVLLVPAEHLARARQEVQTYEETNADWPPPVPPIPEHDPVPGAVLWSVFIVAILLVFHLTTGPAEEGGRYFAPGMLDVGRAKGGEWWRMVTSLALHADFPHVAANSLALLALGISASYQLGPGMAWTLALAGGIGGNALEAWVAQPGRRSLGASTAVFALLAILAVLRCAALWRKEGRPTTVWSRSWLPLFAALGALGFLGTSPGSDLAGHALGFVAGLFLGLGAAALPRRPLGEVWQVPLCVLPLGLIAWAWHLAMHAPL